MTRAVKMDIMHGPLSYLDQAPDQGRFLGCQTFANFNASPPYNMFWDRHPRWKGETILEATSHFVNFILKSAKRSFYKEIKRVIDLRRYRTIYVFHPVDLVSTPEKFSELQEEAKEKDINLISIYHTLKDFKFRTKDEVKELCREFCMREYMVPTEKKINIAMFRGMHGRYVQMIKEYEGLND